MDGPRNVNFVKRAQTRVRACVRLTPFRREKRQVHAAILLLYSMPLLRCYNHLSLRLSLLVVLVWFPPVCLCPLRYAAEAMHLYEEVRLLTAMLKAADDKAHARLAQVSFSVFFSCTLLGLLLVASLSLSLGFWTRETLFAFLFLATGTRQGDCVSLFFGRLQGGSCLRAYIHS